MKVRPHNITLLIGDNELSLSGPTFCLYSVVHLVIQLLDSDMVTSVSDKWPFSCRGCHGEELGGDGTNRSDGVY